MARRALAIYFAFQCNTGQAHPHRDDAIHNYSGLLAAMGRSRAEIRWKLTALRREVELDRG